MHQMRCMRVLKIPPSSERQHIRMTTHVGQFSVKPVFSPSRTTNTGQTTPALRLAKSRACRGFVPTQCVSLHAAVRVKAAEEVVAVVREEHGAESADQDPGAARSAPATQGAGMQIHRVH